MIIVIRPNTPRPQIDEVIAEVQKLGYDPRPIFGTEQTVVAAIGDERTHHTLVSLNALPQVEKVIPVQKRHKLVSRESHSGDTVVDVDGVKIGGSEPFCLMAGPCSVESEEQLSKHRAGGLAPRVRPSCAAVFSSRARRPHEFQGLGSEGLRLLSLAKKETGLKIITEVLSERHVDEVASHTDILQIGARNAQNFQLLIAAAKTGKPILLKRGLSERIEEWLLGAEYLLAHGNGKSHVLRARHPHLRDLHAATRST